MEMNFQFFHQKSLVTLHRRSLAPPVVVLECNLMAHLKVRMASHILICILII